MAEGGQSRKEAPSLSDRIETYRKQVQSLVKQGGEQPQFEFKRSASLLRDNLDDRLDFVKFLQGAANCELVGERCIIIGADPKEKTFYPVDNGAEFDPAKLSQILAAYLHPIPLFEVFQVSTDDGVPFVLIVLSADQPRPILVIKQGHTQSGKIRLELGDVWIKKNTDLQRATRDDIETMYKVRIEKEAEDRARKRLKHLQELSLPIPNVQFSGTRIPTFALLVSPESDLQSFAQELIAVNDFRRFRMLLELGREALIEGWDRLSVRGPNLPEDLNLFAVGVSDFFRDEFLPSLKSVAELGLLAIKFETEDTWLAAVIDVLIDAYEASKGLNWLKSHHMNQRPDSLVWWRPAMEVYIAIRAIAVYAISRSRTKFLASLLPRVVTPISIDDRPLSKVPIIFWPFRDLSIGSELNNGRALYFWNERIGAAWGKYFGSSEKFLASSSQLEFLLEFNSYVGTNTLKDPKLGNWLSLNIDNVSFEYFPDLYSEDFQSTVPMAELVYDVLSTSALFPVQLAIDVRIFARLFGDTQPNKRLEIYAGFLRHLKGWQEQVMFQNFRRFPFLYTWQGRLGELVQNYAKQLKAN